MPVPNDVDQAKRGFLWGVLATLAMSVLMLAGLLTGMSPMPEPVPKAVVTTFLGGGTPAPAILVLAVTAHLAYGGAWAALAAATWSPITPGKGLALGVGLWVLMGLLVLPLVGWGLFGAGATPRIAVVTLVLHLVYGATLGWGMAWSREQEGSTPGTAAGA